jgi:hypothetical protein
VVERGVAVGRDDAAGAVGISRSLAGYHLDKLVGDGLLEARFERRTGLSGPGAGRPAKLYVRAPRQIELSLPARDYAVLTELLAQADPTGLPGFLTIREQYREVSSAEKNQGRSVSLAGCSIGQLCGSATTSPRLGGRAAAQRATPSASAIRPYSDVPGPMRKVPGHQSGTCSRSVARTHPTNRASAAAR